MKIDGISLYITKTLTIYPGDEITHCHVGAPESIGAAIHIPAETVESRNYRVDWNFLKFGEDKSKFEFIYVG